MDIMDIMNSDEYKKMRKLMLADEPYAPCQRCYDLEKVGTWSLRISQNTQQTNKERSAENVEEKLKMLADTNEDGSIDEFKMKYMDIRSSNYVTLSTKLWTLVVPNLWGEEKIKLVDDGVWINPKGRDTLMSVNLMVRLWKT